MSGHDDSEPFDVCGPLPSGVTVLEASAGTGKTFSIAALAARYVAEGIPLEKLLLVTFTRMATGELRERVRDRLVTAERGLALRLAGARPAEHDEVVDLLTEGSEAEVGERHERLVRAVAGFDSAMIATTHGFCQEVLGGLGMAGDVDPGTEFVEDISDLLQEVVDDLYVRRFLRVGSPQFTREQAMSIARMAVENPTAPIEPADAPEDTIAAMRVRLAHRVREELELRKRRTGVMTYDDLLTRLDETLKGPSAQAAVARLHERYRVVLVDEFQDTDPVQWDIVQRAFGQGRATLVLIGDPKQAIYAFRGADVYAYLDAAATAGTRATLRTNWRSDQGLIEAYDALFAGTRLGHEGILYRRVRAITANQAPRLIGAPSSAPLRVRVVHNDAPGIELTPSGFTRVGPAREHIAKDVAAQAVHLLSSGAEIELRDRDGNALRREPVRPGHVAVLVRTHRNAALIREALEEAHVPAVINGAGSVFASEQARDWLWLLEAIERPADNARAHAAALTPFIGWSAERVARASEEEWEGVRRRLHVWARVLRERGMAALAETITLAERIPANVLRGAGGERELTDLRHVAQLLHAVAASEHMGAAALATWLRRRIDEAASDTTDEERSRRLESDAEAVQVLTIHRSKGLEFPVVLYPFLWESTYIPRERGPIFFHDPDNGDTRTIDVGLDGPDFARHQRQHELEQRGEDLRLAYVALTRAQHQAVVWWASSFDSRNSPLGRLLFAREADGHVRPKGNFTPTPDKVGERFAELASSSPGCIAVERSAPAPGTRWTPAAPAAAELVSASFERGLDPSWRRTSFSDITANAHDSRVASEPEEAMKEDEPEGPAAVAGNADRAGADGPLRARSLLADTPVSLHVGTFVHRVLEAADFAAEDLDGELRARVRETLARRRLDVGDHAALVAGLRAAIETPLGKPLGDVRLRDIATTDRLDELQFELPLVGGDDPTASFRPDALAAVLRAHLPPEDPFAAYANRLASRSLRHVVRGYMTGSIDLVARFSSGGIPRYAVVDYKTNWLAGPLDDLTAWHYRPEALTAEMLRFDYPLQALFYTVALHRYLRWRLSGYDPETHLAGVLYLFLRGMSGVATPWVGDARTGVFAWRPPGALVEALSDVLERGEAA